MTAEHHELQTWESLELLSSTHVGRLCVLEGEYPIAIPINYRISDRDGSATATIRTAPNSVLGRVEGPASLEVDDIDLDGGTAWSVIARGHLHRVIGQHSSADPLPIVSGCRQWMQLSISAMSGRRFTIHAAGDGFAVEWQVA
jgi:nitroimidazol reductase NimA-like FMN-containing flavoprotein (pyridoxamine 5'-phosphate oxidase superfamily)